VLVDLTGDFHGLVAALVHAVKHAHSAASTTTLSGGGSNHRLLLKLRSYKMT
jgi:hypothetical protein